MEKSWATSYTLGSKHKPFKWRIDDNNIEIYRNMKSSRKLQMVSLSNLDLIHSYVSKNDWTHLANNVKKIPEGNEREGIGKFMYNELKLSISDAQLASQISALFCQAGTWESNGAVKGMMFKTLLTDWKLALISLYKHIIESSD